MNQITLILISLSINLFAFFEFWVFWAMARKQYEGLRNYFMRNNGFGYVIIRYPEGNILKKFTNIAKKEKVDIDKKSYIIKSDRVYRFEGLPALFYNFGDAVPLKLEEMKKDELWANAEWLNNIFLNIKAAAEAEAEAKNNLKLLLLYITIVLCLAAIGGIGYIIYLMKTGATAAASGGVIVAKP